MRLIIECVHEKLSIGKKHPRTITLYLLELTKLPLKYKNKLQASLKLNGPSTD